jgi:hypothetical protein
MANTKRVNFVRLAEARVNKAIKTIQVVGNLSNRGNYDYSESDVKLIVGALRKEIKDLEAKFRNEGQINASEFRLKP